MQNFVLITGPIAVGKMTVGQELSNRMDYPLLHNHHSIELAMDLFDHGTPEFKSINSGIRRLVFDAVSQSKTVPGFIFTLVWAFDLQEDWDFVAKLRKLFEDQGWRFYIVELAADLEERLKRNKSENRLKHKASKRDVEASRKRLLKHDEDWQMNSEDRKPAEDDYLLINSTQLSVGQVVDKIMEAFDWKKTP